MAPRAPLLRSPRFPGVSADVASVSMCRDGQYPSARNAEARLDALLVRMREQRVGGSFWAAPPPFEPFAILRPRSAREATDMAARALADCPADGVLALLPRARWAFAVRHRLAKGGLAAMIGDVDPWAALLPARQLYAHVDDELVLLSQVTGTALIRADGAACPTDAAMRHATREALLAPVYRDPFTRRETTVEATVDLLAEWRRVFDDNRDIAVAAGIARWKRASARRFFCTGAGKDIRFAGSARTALHLAGRAAGAVAVWPSRAPRGLAEKATAANIPLVRIEDGFVRSAGLGSDLLPPSSIVLDRNGIYYDPAGPSTLEHLLQTTDFSPELLARAEALTSAIVRGGIGKYGRTAPGTDAPRRSGKRVVLVAGQVEDDLSVRLGGAGVEGNLGLLARARAAESDAELWYRPHPDVEAGHRTGVVSDTAALRHADRIVRGGAVATLLERVDAVHVLTSLTGFEALMRGCPVTVHGQPFYAGWGLTRDLAPPIPRRSRRLTLAELVAATLILYPRYLDPLTHLPCSPEIVVRRLADRGVDVPASWLVRARRLQGRARRALRLGFA